VEFDPRLVPQCDFLSLQAKAEQVRALQEQIETEEKGKKGGLFKLW